MSPKKGAGKRKSAGTSSKPKRAVKAARSASPATRGVEAAAPAGAARKRTSEAPPPRRQLAPLVVGLGASAGGLKVLEAFFSEVPADSGMAFVVVTHQSAGRTSLLPMLLEKHASVPVDVAVEGTRLEANHAYVAPPGKDLMVVNGRLHLMDLRPGVLPQLPIDNFFRSLARDQKERAVGIVLSGTGTDGTHGLREIKTHLGMSMVQEEREAPYSGMPHSAIIGDSPDFVISVKDMPAKLAAYARSLDGEHTLEERDEAIQQELLRHIFALLRARTGHDFSAYKDTTVRRRIERRLHLHHFDSLARYGKFLKDNPAEVDRLFDELLIGVTAFFRDAGAFDSLGGAIAELVTAKAEEETIRVWVSGCSTGEEAYSLAILFRECMERAKKSLDVQIFATDLDPKAIDFARAGLYPGAIVADVSPNRLKRFFVREGELFRVRKDVREMLVFATQDLIEDPPFTKLDLLACRNLLIYLDGKLQKRLFPIFHYALRPRGLLFLGSSESIGAFTNLFDPVDKKWKIFRRREVVSGSYVAEIPASLSVDGPSGPLTGSVLASRRSEASLTQMADRLLLRELIPPTVLIRERGDIVHIHGRTGAYLEPAPGPQTAVNVYTMARDGLKLELSAAVRLAGRDDAEVVRRGIRVKTESGVTYVDLRVRRLTEPDMFRGLYRITFERPATPVEEAREAARDAGDPRSPRVAELERELQHTRESHQGTIEELETANEELKSTNEELQSTNEELQSANEELETSKEELQSLNEELQTVNLELQGKVEELSQANDDMTNLLNASEIATVFLDNDLNIKRHTEQAKRVIRLIPSDVGRPIGDLVWKVRYDKLVEDAREVLRTLVFREAEVEGEDDQWFLMRMLPYRTTDNMIDGLVVTFVDISRIKQLQRFERLITDALTHSPVSVFGQQGERYTWAFSSVFGRRPEEVIGKTDDEVLGSDLAAPLKQLQQQVVATGAPLRRSLKLAVSGKERIYDVSIEPQRAGDGSVAGSSCVIVDVTAASGAS